MVTVWKATGTAPERRECEIPGWPERDATGEIMYDNVFFRSEDAAWQKLSCERKAHVSLALARVERAELEMNRATEELDRANKLLVAYRQNLAMRPVARTDASA